MCITVFNKWTLPRWFTCQFNRVKPCSINFKRLIKYSCINICWIRNNFFPQEERMLLLCYSDFVSILWNHLCESSMLKVKNVSTHTNTCAPFWWCTSASASIILIQCRRLNFLILVHHPSNAFTFNPVSSTLKPILWILIFSADFPVVDVFSKRFSVLSYVTHSKREARVVLKLKWLSFFFSLLSGSLCAHC